jgi:hypothetical protein
MTHSDLQHEAQEYDDVVDYYYAFDDDTKRSLYHNFDDDDETKNNDHHEQHHSCRRTAWHQDLYINCNTIHEYDFANTIRYNQTRFVGAGQFREVYVTNRPVLHNVYNNNNNSNHNPDSLALGLSPFVLSSSNNVVFGRECLWQKSRRMTLRRDLQRKKELGV